MKNSFPNNNNNKVMINDLNKWSGIIKKRPKALESYRTLKKFIEGDITKISIKKIELEFIEWNFSGGLNPSFKVI
jgi:hypothetical protein